jgi:hypothetical protein
LEVLQSFQKEICNEDVENVLSMETRRFVNKLISRRSYLKKQNKIEQAKEELKEFRDCVKIYKKSLKAKQRHEKSNVCESDEFESNSGSSEIDLEHLKDSNESPVKSIEVSIHSLNLENALKNLTPPLEAIDATVLQMKRFRQGNASWQIQICKTCCEYWFDNEEYENGECNRYVTDTKVIKKIKVIEDIEDIKNTEDIEDIEDMKIIHVKNFSRENNKQAKDEEEEEKGDDCLDDFKFDCVCDSVCWFCL